MFAVVLPQPALNDKATDAVVGAVTESIYWPKENVSFKETMGAL